MSKVIIGYKIDSKGDYFPIYEGATWEFISEDENGTTEYLITNPQDNDKD